MKRYDMKFDRMVPSNMKLVKNGNWVRWDEVKELLQSFVEEDDSYNRNCGSIAETILNENDPDFVASL